MKISVIIVSYNTIGLLKKCLLNIGMTMSRIDYEIIVVDNASTDGSAEMVERDFPAVRIIKNQKNQGFAKATNQAVRASLGSHLLFLNSDAFVREGAVEKLLKFLDAHPDAAAVGPKVLNMDGTLQNKGYSFPSITYSVIILLGLNLLLPETLKRILFPGYFWGEDETRQVDYLEGSCLLMRRDIFGRVGFFPEVYFMYFEEEEWFYRAGLLGYRPWYLPEAEVFHAGSASPLEDRTEVFERSRRLYYRRNVGRLRGAVIAALQLSATLLDFLLSAFKGRSKRMVLKRQFESQLFLLRGLVSSSALYETEKSA